jgi:hypothetical protein
MEQYTQRVNLRNREYQDLIATLSRDAAYYRRPVDPSHLRRADKQLQLTLNEDWRQSVRLYPQVLDFYYSLVHISFNERREFDESSIVGVVPPLTRAKSSRRQPQEQRQEHYYYARYYDDDRARGRHRTQRSASQPRVQSYRPMPPQQTAVPQSPYVRPMYRR